MKEITKAKNNEILISEIPTSPFPYIGALDSLGVRSFVRYSENGYPIISELSNEVNHKLGFHTTFSGLFNSQCNHTFFLFENKNSWVAWLAGGENTGKKIVKSRSDSVSDTKYYGVLLDIQNFSLKGFITRESFQKGNFIALCTKNVTNGDGWSHCKEETLEGAIDYLLAIGDIKVFEFDSDTELFTWLAR